MSARTLAASEVALPRFSASPAGSICAKDQINVLMPLDNTEGPASQSGVLQPLPVCTVGSNPAVVAFAGLISPGLYQINLTIPAGTPSRDNSIGCTFNGASTPDGDQIAVGQ